MQSGKLKTSYFERLFCKIYSYTTIINLCWIVIINCQVLLFLDNMVLANQNAKLTGTDQGFLVSPLGTRLIVILIMLDYYILMYAVFSQNLPLICEVLLPFRLSSCAKYLKCSKHSRRYKAYSCKQYTKHINDHQLVKLVNMQQGHGAIIEVFSRTWLVRQWLLPRTCASTNSVLNVYL